MRTRTKKWIVRPNLRFLVCMYVHMDGAHCTFPVSYMHTSLLKCFFCAQTQIPPMYDRVNSGWVRAVAHHGEEPHAAAAAAFVARRRSLPPPNRWSGRVGLGWVGLGWTGSGWDGSGRVGLG